MESAPTTYTTIDEYIRLFPPQVQSRLQAIRQIVHEEVPEVEETIKYRMPTFMRYGNLVYFGAFKEHIGFYPTPSGTETFQKELAPYKHAKGSIQFPSAEPLPLELIRAIVRFRVQENQSRHEEKSKKVKSKKAKS
jgi:uncharacterized protein YdhG (YjbR/CyaY superfamily)